MHIPNNADSCHWRNSSPANPGSFDLSSVSVRRRTTRFAHKPMVDALPEIVAAGTAVARAGRTGVFDRDACRFRPVLDEGPKLPPCPATQPGTCPSLGALADVHALDDHPGERPVPNREQLETFDEYFARRRAHH
jgi:hypothetical protein